jgi:hypothetical protein
MGKMVNDREATTRTGLLGYSNLEEANKIINEYGGVFGLANHVALANGMELVKGDVQWGDLVLFVQNGEETLGVILNNEIYTTRVGVGITKFPTDNIRNIWRYK